MTDENNPGEQSSGLPEVAAGVAGGYAGSVITSRFIGKKGLETANNAYSEAKAAMEKSEKLVKNPEFKAADSAFHTAQKSYGKIAANHFYALSGHWEDAARKVTDPVIMGKLKLARYEGQLTHIQGLPATTAEKGNAIEVLKAQIAALKGVTAKENFQTLSASNAKKALDQAINDSWALLKPSQLVSDLKQQADKSAAVFGAMAKAYPEAAIQISSATKASEAAYDAAVKKLSETKNTWDTAKNSMLKNETKALASAEAKVERLVAYSKLGIGWKSALRKPFDVIRLGGNGARLAVVGGAVALGTIAYMGMRAMHSGPGTDASHTDRLDQQRQQAAAFTQR